MEAGSPVDDQAKALFGRTIFEIRGAYKHFGGAIALNYADFTLKSGEIHALLGENGVGKYKWVVRDSDPKMGYVLTWPTYGCNRS